MADSIDAIVEKMREEIHAVLPLYTQAAVADLQARAERAEAHIASLPDHEALIRMCDQWAADNIALYARAERAEAALAAEKEKHAYALRSIDGLLAGSHALTAERDRLRAALELERVLSRDYLALLKQLCESPTTQAGYDLLADWCASCGNPAPAALEAGR